MTIGRQIGNENIFGILEQSCYSEITLQIQKSVHMERISAGFSENKTLFLFLEKSSSKLK